MRNQPWSLWSALALGTAIAVSAPARANGLRCENRLLSEGDSKYDARAVCGEPDATEHRVEKRTVRQRVAAPCAPGSARRCSEVVEQSVDVQIDVWTYDFGPQRFVQYVTFENDKIVRIESGKYGRKRR